MDENVIISSNKEEPKRIEKQQRSWQDLPPDLLGLILSHLHAGDCNAFRSVCKSWRPITPHPQCLPLPLPPKSDFKQSQHPLLMFGNIYTSIYMFFDPLYNQVYRMDFPELIGARFRFSKYNWLLMSLCDRSAFFFNPFTRERLELPKTPRDEAYEDEYINFQIMSFTFPPTSSNCTVVGVTSFDGDRQGYFGILKIGKDWEIHEIEWEKPFQLSGCSPVWCDGLYYCLGVDGSLGIFNPEADDCKWSIRRTSFWRKLRALSCPRFLLENDGGLVAIFVPTSEKKVHVLQWDDTNEDWLMMKGLRDQMLFVSPGASFSQKVIMRGMGNKIYFPLFSSNPPYGIFYSLATWKYHTFYNNFSSESPDRLRLYQSYIWLQV